MATREESKAERRRAIVRAARSLMQETGQAGFSMRALAERAGVSIATPYNLFGSKQAVMYAVLDADLADYQSRLERLKSDELDAFFKAVSLATSLYSAEPGFYRAVLFAAYNDGGTEFRAMFGGPRHAMWRHLVLNAKAAGLLDPELDANSFAINLGHILFSCIMEWVNGLISLEELEARGQYGFAVALRGMATPDSTDRLRTKVLAMQKRLRSLYKKRAAEAATTAGDPARLKVVGEA
ncbi:MAG: TetR/AcrR family transcriptional regulator [Pseudomonadales bacterium]